MKNNAAGQTIEIIRRCAISTLNIGVNMRWVVFLLLLLGALYSLTAFAPATAGKAGMLWPFAADSKPIVGFVGGLPGQASSIVTTFLAGVAGVFFLAAVTGLFWKAIPTRMWPTLVIVAVATSMLLYVLYFGVWMLAPILADTILLWGVLSKRWTAETLPARALRDDSIRIHPFMNVPVPWVFVLTFLVGLGLHYLTPLTIQSAGIIFISRITGMVLTVGGALIAFSSLGIFRAARTTTVPFETPSKLITSGPYRFSRNPMYVGLTLIYLGVAGIQVQIWPVLLLPLLAIYIHRVVIPVEEARLRGVFGDAYEQYCARTRRWV